MFEEVPSPAPPPSQRTVIVTFGGMFAVFLSGAVITWIRWSRPLSLLRKIEAVEIIVCGVLSGVFLLAAKAATPGTNRKRIMALFFVFLVLQVIIDVLR